MYKSIRNYFEYYPSVPEEAVWGFQVTAAGHTRFESGRDYPPSQHPKDRYFTWEQGRVLAAFQLVGIRAGGGVFEWTGGRRRIRAGDCFLLCPGEWHRYRPDGSTGWTEDWFELRGPVVDELVLGNIVADPVATIPPGASFWSRFDEFHEVCLERAPGCRGISAGLARALLAGVLAASESRRRDLARADTRFYAAARERLLAGMPVEQIARELGLSYPSFHRKFKAATQLTPKEYFAQVRHSRAEALLRGGLSIKEIAADLGFHSASHFSIEFKKRAKMAPAVWRKAP